MSRRDRQSDKVVSLHKRDDYEMAARRVVDAFRELNEALAAAEARGDMQVYVLAPAQAPSGEWEYGITRLTHRSPNMPDGACQPLHLAIPFGPHDH